MLVKRSLITWHTIQSVLLHCRLSVFLLAILNQYTLGTNNIIPISYPQNSNFPMLISVQRVGLQNVCLFIVVLTYWEGYPLLLSVKMLLWCYKEHSTCKRVNVIKLTANDLHKERTYNPWGRFNTQLGSYLFTEV